MNYQSQLKSWGIDRAIRMIEVKAVTVENVEGLKGLADTLVAYAYQGEEDFNDACVRMNECLKGMPLEQAIEKVKQMQTELLYVEEQMGAQLNRKEAVQ